MLEICDVAVKTANYNSIGYDATIKVTVMASDTNGYGKLSHDMRIRDIMSSRPAAILDIWRWDNPDWFTGEGQSPNNRLFGQKWDKNLSFENTDNYFTY